MNEQAIFIAALQEAPENRAAYLDRACAGDPALRRRVEALLDAHERAGSFMQEPAAAERTAAYRPLSEAPGAVIGPYKLLQQIGEGGFGVVYMAEQLEPVRRKVALKIIKPGMDTREVIARFESERQALALMDHPNVARVLDAGATDSGRPYFVMELVRGVPITEFCDKNHLPADARLGLFTDVCRAVQHAHQKGIIHRDIKPSNILVTLHDGRPVPKVIDFGVAKATSQQLTQKTLFTAYGQMIGTPTYMSPEQAEMSGLDIDTRSDIYSLGVLLYELLTGTTPLEAKRLRQAGYAEMQRLIREEEAPRPSTRLSSLGGEATVLAGNRGTDVRRLAQLLRGDLDWIVMKALEKDRNRRYETPGDFAADVERFLHNEAVLARPPSSLYKLRKFARRNRAAVLTAATILLLLVVGITGTSLGLVWARRAEREARHAAAAALEAEELAERRRTETGQQRDAANQAKADVERVAAQGDSRRLALESQVIRPTNPGQALLLAVAAARRWPVRSAACNNALLAALRESREERTFFPPPFETPEGRTGHTSFLSVQATPDGTRAAVVGLRSNDPGAEARFVPTQIESAWVYDLKTGQVIATMKLPALWFTLTAISPDGSLLAAATDRSAVVRYEDGQTVVYSDQAVRLWDMRTGKEVRVFKGHTDRVSSLGFDAKGERLLSASWDGTARVWDVATGRELRRLADGTRSMALAEFSPDGRRVLTVDTLQSMTGTGAQETLRGRRFPEPVRPEQVAFDPPVRAGAAVRWAETVNGSGSQGGSAPISRLWDADSGRRIAALTTAKEDDGWSRPCGAAFTPDGARVLTTGNPTSPVEFWNAEDGKPVPVVNPSVTPLRIELTDGPRRLCALPTRWVAGGASPVAVVWQSDKGRREWRRAPETGRLAAAELVGDGVGPRFLGASAYGGALLAEADGDGVKVVDRASGEPVADLRGHEGPVTAAEFLHGDKQLLTASRDGTLRVWDLGRRDPVVEMKRPDRAPVGYATFVNGGQQVLAAPPLDHLFGFGGKTVSLWDAATGALVRDITNDESLATSPLHKQLLGDLRDFDVSPDGTRLATVHLDANPCADRKAEPKPSPLYTPVRVWDLRSGKLLFVLTGLRRSVASARFSPDGRRLLTYADGNYKYAIVTDKAEVYGGGSGGQLWARVDLWDADTGKHLRNVVPEAKGGGDFALWSPDGKHIFTDAQAKSPDVAANIYHADTGERLGTLKGDKGGIDRAAFSPDGKLVLGYRINTLARQQFVDVWDAAGGARRFTLGGHTGDVTSAEFSPDSRSILTTSTDGTARLWDAATGEQRRVLRGHRRTVRAGRFSPDGKWVVTAAADGTARVWAADSGAEWMTLPVAAAEVYGAQFSPDGRSILTTSADGTARLWPMDPLPLAESRKPRELTDDERARFQIGAAP